LAGLVEGRAVSRPRGLRALRWRLTVIHAAAGPSGAAPAEQRAVARPPLASFNRSRRVNDESNMLHPLSSGIQDAAGAHGYTTAADGILFREAEQITLQPMSLRALRLALSGWGLLSITTPLSGQAVTVPAAVAEARRMVSDTMISLGAPGAAICLLRDGKILWSQGFGFADLEQRVPATRETRFRIASVSKAVTSVALGILVERGQLDLDAPVQRYVPSFPVKRYPITVRQVAGHLAGIRHYREGEFESQRRYASLSDGLNIFSADSLLFEPGTRFEYSSYGWNLIGAVIEGASGESYASFMRREVHAPLGM
jgi:hypothetical protein